jgi:hypothetical protein
MSDEVDRLPDPVRVPLAELASVVAALERVLEHVDRAGDGVSVEALDEVIGRMARWAWPLLPEIDEEDGYDE